MKDKIVRGPATDLAVVFTTFLADLEATMKVEQEAIQVWLAHVQAQVHVKDADSLEAAAHVARLAKARLEALEGERLVFSGPLHKWKGQVDKTFKGLTGPLAEVIKVAKDRMGEYGLRKAQERAAAMQASAMLHQAGGTPTDAIPEPAQAPGVSLKAVWRARVVEPDLVPRDLCSPDLDKINASIWYADAARQPRPIPGVEFYQETLTTVRKEPGA
jgi:hypothetical protein